MQLPFITKFLERVTILETQMQAVMEVAAEWLRSSNKTKMVEEEKVEEVLEETPEEKVEEEVVEETPEADTSESSDDEYPEGEVPLAHRQ